MHEMRCFSAKWEELSWAWSSSWARHTRKVVEEAPEPVAPPVIPEKREPVTPKKAEPVVEKSKVEKLQEKCVLQT